MVFTNQLKDNRP